MGQIPVASFLNAASQVALGSMLGKIQGQQALAQQQAEEASQQQSQQRFLQEMNLRQQQLAETQKYHDAETTDREAREKREAEGQTARIEGQKAVLGIRQRAQQARGPGEALRGLQSEYSSLERQLNSLNPANFSPQDYQQRQQDIIDRMDQVQGLIEEYRGQQFGALGTPAAPGAAPTAAAAPGGAPPTAKVIRFRPATGKAPKIAAEEARTAQGQARVAQGQERVDIAGGAAKERVRHDRAGEQLGAGKAAETKRYHGQTIRLRGEALDLSRQREKATEAARARAEARQERGLSLRELMAKTKGLKGTKKGANENAAVTLAIRSLDSTRELPGGIKIPTLDPKKPEQMQKRTDLFGVAYQNSSPARQQVLRDRYPGEYAAWEGTQARRGVKTEPVGQPALKRQPGGPPVLPPVTSAPPRPAPGVAEAAELLPRKTAPAPRPVRRETPPPSATPAPGRSPAVGALPPVPPPKGVDPARWERARSQPNPFKQDSQDWQVWHLFLGLGATSDEILKAAAPSDRPAVADTITRIKKNVLGMYGSPQPTAPAVKPAAKPAARATTPARNVNPQIRFAPNARPEWQGLQFPRDTTAVWGLDATHGIMRESGQSRNFEIVNGRVVDRGPRYATSAGI